MPEYVEQTNQKLRNLGYRLTPQRQMIFSVIESAKQHLTADNILTLVQQRYPYINISTIYRNLDLLKSLGLLHETHLCGEQRYYEPLPTHHHHIICKHCGLITHLADSMLDELRQQLTQQGYEVLVTNLVILVNCANCQAQKKPVL